VKNKKHIRRFFAADVQFLQKTILRLFQGEGKRNFLQVIIHQAADEKITGSTDSPSRCTAGLLPEDIFLRTRRAFAARDLARRLGQKAICGQGYGLDFFFI